MIGIYFSGTGNTKYCVTAFLKHIKPNTPVYSIENRDVVSAVSSHREIVFAYPVYYSNLPKIVRDFIINHQSLWAGKHIYIIATMGLFSGDGAGVSARLFKKYGAKVIGGLHLRMPDCIGDVKALKKPLEINCQTVKDAEHKIQSAADSFLQGKPTQDGLNIFYHMAGLFGQRLYFSRKTKNYTQNPKIDAQKCVGCRKCERACPMNNIHIKNGKAVAGNKCTLCYRCFGHCPEQAITIIGNQVIEQCLIDRYINYQDKL